MSLGIEDRAECVRIYEEARKLWEGSRPQEAKEALRRFWRESGIRTLRQELLMAYILRGEKRYVSEVECLRQLLEKFGDGDDGSSLATAWSLLGEALRNLGESELSVQAFLRSVEAEPDAGSKLVECSNAIFAANASADMTAERMQRLYSEYRELAKMLRAVPFPKADWRHDTLRIGYLSADLHNHPVAQFIRPMFLEYDRSSFEVYAYYLGKTKDSVTAKLQGGGVLWRDVRGGQWERIAKLVREDEIDILVDLSGHTAGNGLPVFLWRPAPVQISGIGYFNSTGLEEVAGFLSDIHCATGEYSPYFTEPLLRLPHSHFCYQPFGEFPEVASDLCAGDRQVTFGCFNNFSKVTDEMLEVWKRLLETLPDARLLLKHSLLGTEEGKDYTRKRFLRLGMPVERIELRGFSDDYLREYREVDIALDTSPYPGGATTCEALFMGVPVVTLAGNRHGARFGCSFLENVGLGELVAKNAAAYVSIAVQLAGDRELLGLLRRELRGMMLRSPLMDSKQYMKDLEGLYRRLCGKATA